MGKTVRQNVFGLLCTGPFISSGKLRTDVLFVPQQSTLCTEVMNKDLDQQSQVYWLTVGHIMPTEMFPDTHLLLPSKIPVPQGK